MDNKLNDPANRMADCEYVLHEFPEQSFADFIIHKSMYIRSQGFIPLIAHMERCESMHSLNHLRLLA